MLEGMQHSIRETTGVNRIAYMHDDLLRLIFEHFDLQPGSQTTTKTRKDLLSAAKSCKAFSEPALNSLWRVLPSLLPLLLLLPSAEIVNGQLFVDNFLSSNWERFKRHARRVRILYMEPSRIVPSPITYFHIRSVCEGPLLPGPRAIYIPDKSRIDLSSVVLAALRAPLNFVELNNSAISDRNFYIPFMTSLASESYQLHHLALRGSGNLSLDPVCRLTSLRRLEIRLPGTYMYPQTLQNLGNMANLLDLTLDVDASAPVPGTDGRLPPFPPEIYRPGKLRRLHVIGTPISIIRVFKGLNLASLTALVIDETNKAKRRTEPFWRDCFEQISVCRAIEDIEINQPTDYRNDFFSLSTSWFVPTLNLENMKSLVITGSALSGSDLDFCRLAGAFPKLKKLIVPPGYYSEGRSLACLFHFAQKCPELLEIKICIAYDIHKNLNAINELPITPKYQHPLEKLCIHSELGRVRLTHTVQIAEFLNLVFPNLSILETYDSNATEASTWREIQTIRVALQTAWFDGFDRAKSELAMTSKESTI